MVVMKNPLKVARFLCVKSYATKSLVGTFIQIMETNGVVFHPMSDNKIPRSTEDKQIALAREDTKLIFFWQQEVLVREGTRLVKRLRVINFERVTQPILDFVRQPNAVLNTRYKKTLPQIVFVVGDLEGSSQRKVNPTKSHAKDKFLSRLALRLYTALLANPTRFIESNPQSLGDDRLSETEEGSNGVVYQVKFDRAFTAEDFRGPTDELVLANVEPRAT